MDRALVFGRWSTIFFINIAFSSIQVTLKVFIYFFFFILIIIVIFYNDNLYFIENQYKMYFFMIS